MIVRVAAQRTRWRIPDELRAATASQTSPLQPGRYPSPVANWKGEARLSASRAAVEEIVTSLLVRLDKPVDSLDEGTLLFHEGLDLDSLETAELSVLLEDELGRDPFSEGGTLPATLGEIYAFYDS